MRGGLPNRGKKQKGYTIVEVMIFLAVSGLMFVMAAGLVSGKQSKAEFKQGMSAVNAQLVAIPNDVANGFYPSNSGFSCTVTNGVLSFSTLLTNGQGSNKDCVFLGKVLQFDRNGTDYSNYTIAGSRLDSTIPGNTTVAPTTFKQASPTIPPSSTNTVSSGTLEWGVKLLKIQTGGGDDYPNTELNGVGFFSSFGSYDDVVNNSLASGSQSVIVVPIVGALNAATSGDISSQLNPTAPATVKIDNNPDINFCFDSGNGQYGILTLGGNNGQAGRLATTTTIQSSIPDWCKP